MMKVCCIEQVQFLTDFPKFGAVVFCKIYPPTVFSGVAPSIVLGQKSFLVDIFVCAVAVLTQILYGGISWENLPD